MDANDAKFILPFPPFPPSSKINKKKGTRGIWSVFIASSERINPGLCLCCVRRVLMQRTVVYLLSIKMILSCALFHPAVSSASACLRLPPPANCCFSSSSQSESVYFADDDEPLSLVYINKDWFLFSSYGGLQGNPMGKEKVNTLWYSTDTQLWRPPQSFVLVGRRGRQLYQQILYTTHGKAIKLASSWRNVCACVCVLSLYLGPFVYTIIYNGI